MDLIEDDKLIFLLCSERSGSNFITKLFNNHPEVCGPSTKHIINPLARNYFRYQPLSKRRNWELLIDDLLNLFNVEFSIWQSKFAKEEIVNSVETGNLSQLIKYFFSKETYLNQKKYCIVKEIKAYEFYPFLKAKFKNPKFLFQVRDPRDMALSWKKSSIHFGGVVAAARQWKNDQQQYLKILELERESTSITLLKYEDLISNTESELKRILKVYDLDFNSSMLEMRKDNLTAKNAKAQESWVNLSKPVMSNNSEKYKNDLSPIEIKFIENICYFEMQYLGYQTNHNWSSLSKINSEEIQEFHTQESLSLNYEPNLGVKSNMKAKQRFYQHLK